MPISTIRLHPKLPLFRLDQSAQIYLYTPGHSYQVTRDEADALQYAFAQGKPLDSALARLAATLMQQARKSQHAWEQLGKASFAPVCLTLYLSNCCNLGCAYCFAAPARLKGAAEHFSPSGDCQTARNPVIQEAIVEKAAHLVAGQCADSNRPFTLVLHGGGEPTLHWELLKRLVSLTRRVAAMHDVDWWGYISTNGVLSESKAAWLADQFNLIGLSCDGPPAIHDRQRPTIHGGGTSAIVERTARRFVRAGVPFVVRATITPEFTHQQSAIVRYLHENLGTQVVRFEPVYRGDGSPGTAFRMEDAEPFATAFLAAQRTALTSGINLSLSGVRMDEIHGPYCHVLRNVLHLTPNGKVSACFLCTGDYGVKTERRTLTEHDSDHQRFILDVGLIAELRRRALGIPARCSQCVNLYHCARDCPDVCPVLDGYDDQYSVSGGFRCKLYQRLAENWIQQSARPHGEI